MVGRVVAGGPAERAGLQVGDTVTAVTECRSRQWDQLTRAVQARPDAAMVLLPLIAVVYGATSP